MSELQERILSLLDENGPMTARQIADVIFPKDPSSRQNLDHTNARIDHKLRQLRKFGLVEVVDQIPKGNRNGSPTNVWGLQNE